MKFTRLLMTALVGLSLALSVGCARDYGYDQDEFGYSPGWEEDEGVLEDEGAFEDEGIIDDDEGVLEGDEGVLEDDEGL